MTLSGTVEASIALHELRKAVVDEPYYLTRSAKETRFTLWTLNQHMHRGKAHLMKLLQALRTTEEESTESKALLSAGVETQRWCIWLLEKEIRVQHEHMTFLRKEAQEVDSNILEADARVQRAGGRHAIIAALGKRAASTFQRIAASRGVSDAPFELPHSVV
jgi:hypothetical protein